LPEGHVLLALPGDEVEHRDPGAFLLDPNPAVTRAGLVEDLARGLDIGSVDIRRRGLAGDVEDLHRQLKLCGTRRATLVMTRVNDRPWSLICVDV
ncbi:MAG: hypothetical protein WBF75_17175, partial [Pseudonocardiaceae bacterium]